MSSRQSSNAKPLCALLLIFSVAISVFAKEKQRDWQTGTLLDASQSRIYAGTINSASGSATTNGDTTYGQANGGSTAVYRVYETYTIQSGDYIYICQEHIKWRWSKAADVTVNGPVQFAIEKNHLYIKDADGTEHETTILKRTIAAEQRSQPTQQQPVEPNPAPTEKGAVLVNSSPSGAEIYVDGAFVGNTPATLKLAEGKHAIKVSMSGYLDWTRDLSVLGGSDVTLAASLVKSN